MYKETIVYKDYDDVEREETFYFNLTKSELTELETSIPGGMANRLSEISKAKDTPAMMKFFKMIIMKSYGEKSPDGRRLIKGDNCELAKAFAETPAYDIIFQKIFMGDGMVEFLTNIMPSDMMEKMRPVLDKHLSEQKLPAGA